MAALIAQHQRELGAVGGLAGALQTAHHHNGGRMRRGIEPGTGTAHQLDQFLVDDLDDHLRRRQALHDLRADRALGHLVGEILGDLVVHVCFQQRQTYLAHGGPHVRLRQAPLAFQEFECIFKFIGKTFKGQEITSFTDRADPGQ